MSDKLPKALEEFVIVESEVARAVTKFPRWPTDPLHALAVLGEEFGELTKAMLQLTYEPHKTSPDEVRVEALQTAAMAMRLYRSLERYEYRPSSQHDQGQKAIRQGKLDDAKVIAYPRLVEALRAERAHADAAHLQEMTPETAARAARLDALLRELGEDA